MGFTLKLLKSSFVRTLSILLQIVVSFLMTPLIVHSLGDRMYGFWIFVGTFLGYFGLLDLGLSSAVTRYVSRAVGDDDNKEINRIVSTSIVIFSIIGFFILFITAAVILLSSYFINNNIELDLFKKIVAILGISLSVGFPVRVFCGILNAKIRYDLISYAGIIKLIIANVSIFVLLKYNFGILSLALASFLAAIIEYYLIALFATRIFPGLIVKVALFDRAVVGQLFNYSWKTFIAQLADIMRFKVDALVIAGCLNVGLVTYYSIGARLVEYFSQLMMSATGIMTPVFSHFEGKGDYDAIRSRFLEVTQLCVILSIFIGSGIIFYSKWFIARWMGPGFESSYVVAVILCISVTVALMQTTGIGLLYGISKHHYYSAANACEGILNLVLSLVLVRYYGIYGVALGTMLSMLLFKLAVQPIFVCKSIGLPIKRYYVDIILITSCKSMLPLIFYYYFIKDFIKADYANIVTFAIPQCCFYVIFVYIFILSESNKLKFKNTFEYIFSRKK